MGILARLSPLPEIELNCPVQGSKFETVMLPSVRNYRLVRPLGAGGMGEVYQAHDTRLDRPVALKFLPMEFATDSSRRQRFLTEAKAVAALNHPNICTIYDVGETDDGQSFIAMELLEGEILSARIKRGKLEIKEVIETGLQVAEALAVAHGRGIVHRDIKPSNIHWTTAGRIKLLDFGVAKRFAVEPGTSEAATQIQTQIGQLMGTPNYMSPEQALGKEVDARTDIFSFGVVLYEMVTERLPFAGGSLNETIERILHSSPDAMARFNYEMPQELERIILKCLRKAPEERYQSAGELVVDFRSLKESLRGSEAGSLSAAVPAQASLRQVVTLLFLSTNGEELEKSLGAGEATQLLRAHEAQLKQRLNAFGHAWLVESAGNTSLLNFERPSSAVQFALAMQRATNKPLTCRMGIHLGEIVKAQGENAHEQFGDQFVICERLLQLARPDQILMSRAVFDSARQVVKAEDLGGAQITWMNHGPYLFQGLDGAVEICEVAEATRKTGGPPATSDKAQRYVSPDSEPVLGWRPAAEQVVPATEWVLKEKLGEGGFGEVWLGMHRKLKEKHVFKFCFRADRVRTLKREVTLFRLVKERVGEHPNVVRLLDVFFDEPPFYIVEEYVEGKDLKTWSEAQGGMASVPLDTRLEIIAQAADALQAAHDAGVIHRDVKPGNILISQASTVNRQPCAKLSDFGIGQVISEEYFMGVTRAGFTQTMLSTGSSQTGTQLYMAPELIAGKSASIRSDIYSLGVVLYQLLAGDFTRPLTADWTEDVPDPLLREDLRLCVAGKPEERFAGGAQLAKNLRALPARRAELARQEFEKKALELAAYRRGMMRTAGVAVVIVAIIAALALAAVNQSRRAKAESVRSAQVAAFLKGMLKSVGPSVALGRDTALLKEVLTNTVSRLDKELANQPEVEADLRLALGRTYKDLGDYPAAAAMDRRALDLRRRIFGARDEAVAESLNELAKPLSLQGNWTEAEALQREALAIRQARLGRDHLVVADMLNDLGIILWNSAKLREAREAYRQALAIKERQLQSPNVKLAQAHQNLSILLLDLGELAQGEAEAREAVTQYRQLYGENHPSVGEALHNQAKLLRELARLDDSERAIRNAIEIYGRVYEGGHDYHAEALDDLGLILERKGDATAAEAAFRDSLTMAKRVVGEDHPQTLQAMRHLGLLLSRRAASVSEAEELIQRATASSRQKFAKQPAVLAACLADQGRILVNIRRPKDAEPALLEAFHLLTNSTPSSPHLKKICRDLQLVYGELNRPGEVQKWAARLANLEQR